LTILPLPTIYQNMEEKNIQEELQDQQSLSQEEVSAGNEDANQVNDESNQLQKLQSEVEELKDKYLRQAAEFDNFRRRTAKEKVELISTAGKEVIGSLLEVLDDSERAEKQLKNAQDLEALKEGFRLVFIKLRTTLQARGLKAMESIGTEFNPDIHEAITEIPSPSPEMVGKVIDEVEKGYYLNDKIIRFAKVVVGK
jgi:molecular chaperone GrpE